MKIDMDKISTDELLKIAIDMIDEEERNIEITESGDSENIHSRRPNQWSILENDKFSPAYSTVPRLPAGVYEIVWDSSLQTLVLQKQKLQQDELYELPSPEIQSILDDITLFCQRRDVYKKYNFVHKRGILLYGDPGCGKSGIIQLCMKNIIESESGIVINIKDEEDFKSFVDFIPTVKKIESARPIIVILEDLDSLASGDKYSTTKLLNILDGVKQIDNVVYIATTNYPDKLEERITNRPSRFDRRYKVELPSREIRKAYIKNKLDDEDIKKIDIDEWVESTEGMSLSHLKELIISVIVMGKDFVSSMQNLSEMKETPKIGGPKKVGFGAKN